MNGESDVKKRSNGGVNSGRKGIYVHLVLNFQVGTPCGIVVMTILFRDQVKLKQLNYWKTVWSE